MGVAAILVMLPRCREQTFVGGSKQNFALISQAVWEKKMFEIVNGRGTKGHRSIHLLPNCLSVLLKPLTRFRYHADRFETDKIGQPESCNDVRMFLYYFLEITDVLKV